MFRPDYLGGGFSATFIDVTITGDLAFGSVSVNELFLGDDDYIGFGNVAGSPDVYMGWNTEDASAHYFNVALGTSRNFIISEDKDTDWGHAASTNPTFGFIQQTQLIQVII